MKQRIIIIALGAIISCNKSESLPETDKTGRRIFYNDKEYSNSKKQNEEVVVIDTACIAQKEKALRDIKENKLTYYYNRIGPHEREFKIALRKYGISAELGLLPNCLIDGRFVDECYEREMDEEVNRRYGNKFFDSIWNKTLLEHVKKFPNDSIVEGGKVLKWKDVYKSILK